MVMTKSAIRQVRDQLYLDTAEGKYLTAVTNNIGLDRPKFGMTDDAKWRAIARRLALDTRQIEGVFRDLLTIIFGPKTTAVTVLAANSDALDDELTVSDPTNIPQLGTLVIDPGLASEETLVYTFRHPGTGVVTLADNAVLAHTALSTNAESYLIGDYSAGATSIQLLSTYDFPEPTGGATVPVLIGAGTDNEEIVQVSNNNKITNTLTVSALVYDHVGPKAGPVTSELSAISSSEDVITVDSAVNFPLTGYIRITELGGTPTEGVAYSSKSNTTNQIVLKRKLTNSYTTAYVDLLEMQETAKLAQVKVASVDWDVFQTEPNVFQIYLPIYVNENTLRDVSFLHGSTTSTASTTVASLASAGDKVISVNDTSNFDESGLLLLDSGGASEEYVGYYRIDRQAATITVPVSSGTDVSFYVNDTAAVYDMWVNHEIETILINEGGLNQESANIVSIDKSSNKIIVDELSNSHDVGETFEIGDSNKIYLLRALTNGHAIGHTVAQFVDNYGSTDLEDGTIYASTEGRFQGPYTYNHGDRAFEATQTTLAEALAGPVDLFMSQLAGRTAIEVQDAALFNSTDPQQIRIGRNIGNMETVDISDIVLRRAVNDVGITISGSAPSAGDTTFTISAAELPEAWGYRIFIDENGGGVHEEIAIVRSVTGTSVTLEEGFQYNHSIGDNIKLLADVIKTDALEYDHEGFIPIEDKLKYTPDQGSYWSDPATELVGRSERVSLVEEIRDYITVVSDTTFVSTGGYALINPADGLIPIEARLSADANAGVSVIYVNDGSLMPSTDFYVEIGVNTREYEVIHCSSRTSDTQLNLSDSLMFNHKTNEAVRSVAGSREAVYYTGKDSNKLLFSSGIALSEAHAKGELISDSSLEAIPSHYGEDYPFYLPSTWADRLYFVFELARAAGVKIEIITSR